MNEIKVKADVAILIGRYQVDELHSSHSKFIEELISRYNTVVIFLGVAPNQYTKKNPLDFLARQKMIQSKYPSIVVLPTTDHLDDTIWSNNLDNMIETLFPTSHVILYGGRDSFIKAYHGKFQCVEVELIDPVSGTEVRNKIGKECRDSDDFRAGLIYATQRIPHRINPLVHLIIVKDNQVMVIKDNDYKKYVLPYRFMTPNDTSLESVAKSLVSMELNNLRYLTSQRIHHWKFTEDILMSSIFVADYSWGNKTSDQHWISLENLDSVDPQFHSTMKAVLNG